jgi:hypothetical protein
MSIRAVLCVALAGLLLAACGTTISPATAMRRWAANSDTAFAAAATTLLSDSQHVRAAIDNHQPASTIRTVCEILLGHAQAANNFLPTPDPQLTGQLSNAYDRLVQAADHCYDGVGDPARLASAEAEQRTAIGLLVGAVLREEFVSGRSLGIAGIPGAS